MAEKVFHFRLKNPDLIKTGIKYLYGYVPEMGDLARRNPNRVIEFIKWASVDYFYTSEELGGYVWHEDWLENADADGQLYLEFA